MYENLGDIIDNPISSKTIVGQGQLYYGLKLYATHSLLDSNILYLFIACLVVHMR